MAPLDPLHRGFGVALRSEREQAGLSQEAVAHSAGLSRNYVSDLELGNKSPSLRTIAKIARVLGVAPHELIRAAERAVRG